MKQSSVVTFSPHDIQNMIMYRLSRLIIHDCLQWSLLSIGDCYHGNRPQNMLHEGIVVTCVLRKLLCVVSDR
jgi:hypothetical protein